ncbi:MAG: glycosyltransferase involved in cell wall biosynthesis [Myxococcota bacterium]|jgi:glycosyltransferase involved in cell wall biosynthesis
MSKISIIVPAHNEANVIGRCLQAMTEGAKPGELEILVVCNGCTDNTREVAEGFGEAVTVLESEVASKNAALNLGHASATSYPRFYIDADIVLPLESIRKVADVLRSGKIHGAAPRMRVDLEDRGWPIRAYYDIWLRTPYVEAGMLGSGVYAISEEGGSRFTTFPDIIADDGFVRLLFEPDERLSVDDTWFLMTPPETLRSLIHINVRRRVGRFEMAELHPDTSEDEATYQRGALYRLFLKPSLWPGLAVYLYAKFACMAIYAVRQRQGRHKEWNRDDTSRKAND